MLPFVSGDIDHLNLKEVTGLPLPGAENLCKSAPTIANRGRYPLLSEQSTIRWYYGIHYTSLLFAVA